MKDSWKEAELITTLTKSELKGELIETINLKQWK